MTSRLLLIDDDARLTDMVGGYLRHNGFEVDTAGSLAAGREQLKHGSYDALLLDLMLPDGDGLDFTRELRGQPRTRRLPLLMLTARGEPMDRIVGLEIGADDYLPKPFEPRELLARVRSVIRRLQAAAGVAAPAVADAAPRQVRFGACRLDLDMRRLFGADEQEIEITAAEYDLLALFARHPNRPLSRDTIMEQAHNRGWDVFDRSIDLRMMRLRRKIERNPDKPEVLKTVRNVGYVFVPG